MAETVMEIQQALHYWIGGFGQRLVVDNVFVLESPWESDVVAVTKAGYWTEFEIKLSVSDYNADFRKRFWRGTSKHYYYAGDGEPTRGWGKAPITRPKHFWFVTPAGLLDRQDLPEHCGHLEYSQGRLRVRKSAPRLKKPTQLGQAAVFNLACKLASKLETVQRNQNGPQS